MTAGPSPITLVLSDEKLHGAFTRALAEARLDSNVSALVVAASGGLAGLSVEAASAVEALRARGSGSVVLVATSGGVGWDALQGLARSYAAALAPGVRVNAIAPARAGDGLDAGQAAAALIYLMQAEAVTGQTIFVGPEA